MHSLWNETDRRGLVERASRLTAETAPGWGKMNCPQMLAHVNDALRMAVGDLPTRPRKTVLRFFPLKQLGVYVLPFPRGVPTARELLARIDDAQFGTEAVAFPARLDRFVERAKSPAEWPVHPAFGPLSKRAWGALAWRHVDHHWKQFGV